MSEERKCVERRGKLEEYDDNSQDKTFESMLGFLTANDSFLRVVFSIFRLSTHNKEEEKKMNDIFESVVDVGSGFILGVLIQLLIFV